MHEAAKILKEQFKEKFQFYEEYATNFNMTRDDVMLHKIGKGCWIVSTTHAGEMEVFSDSELFQSSYFINRVTFLAKTKIKVSHRFVHMPREIPNLGKSLYAIAICLELCNDTAVNISTDFREETMRKQFCQGLQDRCFKQFEK